MKKKRKSPLRKRIYCLLYGHTFELATNLSYHNTTTGERSHEITIRCKHCRKLKHLPKFTTPNNQGLS